MRATATTFAGTRCKSRYPAATGVPQVRLDVVANETPEPRMRIGSAEKNVVLETLGKAYADGQLDHEELEERQNACLVARFADELPALTADLSTLAVVQPSTHKPHGAPLRISVMSGRDILLDSELPTVRSFAFWGGNSITVGNAIGPGVRLELSLTAIMAGHKVLVPPGVRVLDKSKNLMGGVDINPDARGDGSNGTLIIRGFNFMAGTEVSLYRNHQDPEATD